MVADYRIEIAFVPSELADRKQWVIWRVESRDGKPTKVAIKPSDGCRASSTDPADWVTYDEAANAVGRFNYRGVGYMFADNDGISGIDLDDCRDPETVEISLWAREIIHALDSYTEVSASRTGAKIWVRGKLLEGAGARSMSAVKSRSSHARATSP